MTLLVYSSSDTLLKRSRSQSTSPTELRTSHLQESPSQLSVRRKLNNNTPYSWVNPSLSKSAPAIEDIDYHCLPDNRYWSKSHPSAFDSTSTSYNLTDPIYAQTSPIYSSTYSMNYPTSPNYSPSSSNYSRKSTNYSPTSPTYSWSSSIYSAASPTYSPSSPNYFSTSLSYLPTDPKYSKESPSTCPASPSYSPLDLKYPAESPKYSTLSPTYSTVYSYLDKPQATNNLEGLLHKKTSNKSSTEHMILKPVSDEFFKSNHTYTICSPNLTIENTNSKETGAD